MALRKKRPLKMGVPQEPAVPPKQAPKPPPVLPPPPPDNVAAAKRQMQAYWGGHDLDADHLTKALLACSKTERELLALSVPILSTTTVTGQRCAFVRTVMTGLTR